MSMRTQLEQSQGGLARGRLTAGVELSTGSANDGVVFAGRNLIRPGWRQARGTIDPTGANNGLEWRRIVPGRFTEDVAAAVTVHYDGAKAIALTPLDYDRILRALMVPGASDDISVSGDEVTFGFVAGTTTYADLAELLAGTLTGMTAAQKAHAARARRLFTMSGTAGTLPATWEGCDVRLARCAMVEYVQAAATAVDWDGATGVVTVGLDLSGGGDSVANIKAALAASASGANHVVQVADAFGSSGAGDITTGYSMSLSGGLGECDGVARLRMAQGSNKDLDFDTRAFGADRDEVAVAMVNDSSASPPVVDVTRNQVRALVRVRMKQGTSTALHILHALRASAEAMGLISANLAPGSTGAGTPTAFAETRLLGDVSSARAEAYADAAAGTVPGELVGLTDDAVTVDFAALGATHPADSLVDVYFRLCGIEYHTVATVVA